VEINHAHGGALLTALLVEHGVEYVFGLPGGQTYALYDGINQHAEISHILVRDERTGVYAADGYARATGKVGVCDATVGPGAANLPAGLGEALGASIPIVALVSALPANLTLHQYRSAASQAMDQINLLAPVSKWSATVPSLEAMPALVRQAFQQATTGRPGPTVLFLPQDILDSKLPEAMLELLQPKATISRFGSFPAFRTAPDPDDVQAAAQIFNTAKRPIIIAGGGALISGAIAELAEFADAQSCAVATSLSGKGVIAENHPWAVGVVGQMGTPAARAALEGADVVVFLGTKAGSGPTFAWSLPRADQKIIQIDIDPAEIGRSFANVIGIFADARSGLQALAQATTATERSEWKNEISKFKSEWNTTRAAERSSEAIPILPQRVLGELQAQLSAEDLIVCDASLSSGWAGVYYEQVLPGKKIFMPRGLAGLGYSVPAAIGVAIANPNKRTIVLTGDGALGYSIGEFASILELDLPITVIVLNNADLGWIRWYGHLNFGISDQGSDFADINFSAVAQGFGFDAERVTNPGDLAAALKRVLSSKKPSLLDVVTETWTTPVTGHKVALAAKKSTGYGG
jgi:acetolactate synthase-1/2/3 large subunit